MSCSHTHRTIAPVVFCLASVMCAQTSYRIEIVHTNEPGHPANAVPGMPGVAFNAGTAGSTAFWRPTMSGNGSHWGMRAAIETTQFSMQSILLVDEQVVLQSGTAVPWGPGTDLLGPMRETFGINDAGDLLVINNTSAFSMDDFVVQRAGGSWVVLAQDGQLVQPVLPGLVGGASAMWGSQLSGPQLSNAGPAWLAAALVGMTTGLNNNNVCVGSGGSAVRQKGVDVPSNQAGGVTAAWDQFLVDNLWVSPDGSVTVVQGNTLAANAVDGVVTVNDEVVVHEGAVLDNSGFAQPVDQNGIVKAWVDAGNNWYVRGNNDQTEEDWVYRNGVVVARSGGGGSFVVPGSSEQWSDQYANNCFSGFDGNVHGDYLLAGETDATPAANGVLLVVDAQGNRQIVWREGTPFDLDGNGLFDDDRFLSAIGNDDVLLADDGTILMVCSLRNALNFDVSTCVLRLHPVVAACTQRNGSGSNPLVCACATLPVLGTSWNVTVMPAANTVLTVALVGTAALPVPVPLSFGEALVTPPVLDFPSTSLGNHSVALPSDPSFVGVEFFVQGLRVNLVGGALELELSNAVDAIVSTS